MPVSDEPLDHVAKTMVTKTTWAKIIGDTKPGRKAADVLRDAVEFYFEYRGKILSAPKAQYRLKGRK